MPALQERVERKQQAAKDTVILSSERYQINLRTLHNVHANPIALCLANQTFCFVSVPWTAIVYVSVGTTFQSLLVSGGVIL